MSWLARSIANSLHLDDEADISTRGSRLEDAVSPEDQLRAATISIGDQRLTDSDDIDCYNYDYDGDGDDRDSEDNNLGRGMKEDLSEFKDTLTRQFWGVASFLAPPPPPPPPPPPLQKSGFLRPEMKSDRLGSNNSEEEEEEEEEELEYDERDSGRFGEFSNFSQLEDYSTNAIEDAVGITEEVLAFARNIAHHPETWLDFPLSEEEEFDGLFLCWDQQGREGWR